MPRDPSTYRAVARQNQKALERDLAAMGGGLARPAPTHALALGNALPAPVHVPASLSRSYNAEAKRRLKRMVARELRDLEKGE